MTKFKLNQRVYSKIYKQYGKIQHINLNMNILYPIEVRFDKVVITYTKDGREFLLEPPSLITPLEEKINKLMKL